MSQTPSTILSKLFGASGVCLVLLSLVVFIDHANAGCSGCTIAGSTCLTMIQHPTAFYNPGICGPYGAFNCVGACTCVPVPLSTVACECK